MIVFFFFLLAVAFCALKSVRRYETPGGKYSTLYRKALDQPHLLIAGATGSGKSVFIAGLMSVIMHRLPCDTAGGAFCILIDPKRVELVQYKNLPHCIRYASEPDSMLSALQYAMTLTEQRYKKMQRQGLKKYNGADIWVIIDEFADLMTTQRKTVHPLIQRLAQIGRAARVHIVLATQTPIAKVIPTEIKCNFDARVGLRTRSAQDSRNIIGMAGLENLPRYGQCYYMSPEEEGLCIVPMVDDAEIDRLVKHWTSQKRRLWRQK